MCRFSPTPRGRLRRRASWAWRCAQNLANFARAFAKARQLDEKLFATLTRAAQPRLGEFKPAVLANTAWAFATFAALARAAESRFDEFNAQDIAITAWAFATVSHIHLQPHSLTSNSTTYTQQHKLRLH